MQRIVSLLALVALGASLLVPVAVFAQGPPEGKGPSATPPGLQKKAERAVEPDTSEQGDRDEKRVDKAEQKAEKAEGKVERKAGAAADKDAKRAVREQARAVEETETPEPGTTLADGKQTGIANALSRIMRNIERAEARVESGQKSQVPPGLLRVMSKFFGWLGIDPGTQSPPPDPLDGSSEDTSTVLPDDGSDEDTSTLDPL